MILEFGLEEAVRILMISVCALGLMAFGDSKLPTRTVKSVTLAGKYSLHADHPEMLGGRMKKVPNIKEEVLLAMIDESAPELVILEGPRILEGSEEGDSCSLSISIDQSHEDTPQWICDRFGYGKLAGPIGEGRESNPEKMLRLVDPATDSLAPLEPVEKEALAKHYARIICERHPGGEPEREPEG